MRGISSGERTRVRSALWPILLASTALTGVPPAFAQQAGTTAALESVTVTAEKREENLQKAPLSIQAFSNEKLEQLHINRFADYAQFLPSVAYTSGGNSGGNAGPGGGGTVYMRGVVSGNDGNHSGSLPSVGTYLDEQPITTIGGALDIHTYDIERVEALAGPQGTLYGASSQAGTLRIITNKPDPSGFAAGYNVGVNAVDHGGIGYVAEGFVNEPISDNAAIRIVAWDEHDAGFIDNVHGTRTYPTSGITINNAGRAKSNYNDAHILGARAALKVDLNDNWTITPTIMGQQQNSNGAYGFDPSVGDLKVVHFYPEFTHDSWYQAALTIQGKISNLDLVYSGGYMGRNIHSASDYTDYSYWYDSIYGYGNYIYDDHYNLVDPSQYILGKDYFTKDSQELRISSPKEDRLRFIAGLFYERQTHWIVQDYKINAIDELLSVPGWPHTLWLTDQMRTDRDYAAFGEVSFDITPKLTLTGGIRFFKADNSLKGFFGFNNFYSKHTGVSQCPIKPPPNPKLYAVPCINLDKEVKETGETHKINLAYQIDDDHLVYATYSTGFRPGGINRRGTIPPYAPDTLTNYEIGWKTSWDHDRFRFNGAIYWEDWKGFQFSFLGLNSFTEIHNAGSATIKGLESDFSWLVTDNLTLSGAGAYNDAKLDTAFCGTAGVTVCPGSPFDPSGLGPEAPAGTQLPITPKYKANITARYEFNAWDMNAHLQASGVYQSSSWPDLRVAAPDPINPPPPVDPIRSAIGKQPGFGTVDFSFGLEKNNWSLELSLTNAFDTRGQLYRFAECTTQVCSRQPYIVTDRPRTIGLTFGQKF